MAIEDFFNHRCDVYHLSKNDVSMGFGIHTGKYNYPEIPCISGVRCHFNVSDSRGIKETDITNKYSGRTKLQLPVGTDIRLNDKVVDCDSGIVYTAEMPKNIRDHHIIVYVYTNENVMR